MVGSSSTTSSTIDYPINRTGLIEMLEALVSLPVLYASFTCFIHVGVAQK